MPSWVERIATGDARGVTGGVHDVIGSRPRCLRVWVSLSLPGWPRPSTQSLAPGAERAEAREHCRHHLFSATGRLSVIIETAAGGLKLNTINAMQT